MSPAPSYRHSVRSVFISDVHLGSRGCNAVALVEDRNGRLAIWNWALGDGTGLRTVGWQEEGGVVAAAAAQSAREAA